MWMFCTRLKMYKAASRDFNFFKRVAYLCQPQVEHKLANERVQARPKIGGGGGDEYGADRPNVSDPPP